MLRYKNGARGMIWASQVAPGNENDLTLRVYGTKGGLEWAQEDPNYLWFAPFGEPKRLITRGGAGAGAAAARVTRVPPGHPEGYLEGFANIYKEAAAAIIAARSGKKPDKAVIFPTVEDGVEGRRLRRRLRALLEEERGLGDALGKRRVAALRGRAASSPICPRRAREADAVVQAEGAVLPELDLARARRKPDQCGGRGTAPTANCAVIRATAFSSTKRPSSGSRLLARPGADLRHAARGWQNRRRPPRR